VTQAQTGNDQVVVRYVDYKSGLASVYKSIGKVEQHKYEKGPVVTTNDVHRKESNGYCRLDRHIFH
jgi:hypothetical protein